MSLISVLKQPHPRESDFPSYLRNSLLVAIGVTFVLSFLQPFGINEIEGALRWKTGLYFGAVTLGVLIANYLLMLVLPFSFDEKHWTLGRELLWSSYNFTAISFGNFLLGGYLFPRASIFFHYGPVLFITVGVGLFPYLLLTYIKHNRYLRRHLRKALDLNQQIDDRSLNKKNPEVDPAILLRFVDEDRLLPPITLNQLLYVEAEGNYLRIWVLSNGEPKDYRLRATLKQQEQLWAEHLQLFRSHRSFLVNLEQVQQVSGNSAGYRLTIHLSLPAVPVSRGQINAFNVAFQGLISKS